ncbi:MAG: hypothetical protein Q8N23_13775 [Archangium sp.]|nr:hypothetical protein [Archangium sp.]MDP3153742.1 hypothetical protein [Archangium sp.]MDP3569209.1 hypothetical protein [Archangium sp.]
MLFEESQPGLIIIRYREKADLEVERQGALLARLEAVAGPVVLIFDVAAEIRMVPMDVPNFWLGVTGRAELLIKGMAIVTSSAAVRVAAGGFSLANTARGISTEVKTVGSVEAATDWARALLS